MERSLSDPNPLQLAQAAGILRAEPRLCAAWIHGSCAKASARADSDVDIAMLAYPGKTVSAHDLLELAGALEPVFQRPVDLGLLSTRNLVYCKEVIAGGRLLFSADRFISDRFMAQALALYADLQERRKGVLDAYAA